MKGVRAGLHEVSAPRRVRAMRTVRPHFPHNLTLMETSNWPPPGDISAKMIDKGLKISFRCILVLEDIPLEGASRPWGP